MKFRTGLGLLAAAAMLAAGGVARAGFLLVDVSIPSNPDTYAWSNIGTDGNAELSLSAPITTATSYQLNLTVDNIDPTMRVLQDIVNTTGVAWDGYTITIAPDLGWTLSNVVALAPVFQPDYLPTKTVVGNQIIYSGGVVNPGDTLETVFQFDVTATGGTFGYNVFNQPHSVPEPASLSVAGLGAVLLMRRRRAK